MERRGLRARAEGRIRLLIAPASRYELQSSRNSVRSYCGQCTRGASKTGAKFTANNIQLFFFFSVIHEVSRLDSRIHFRFSC